MKITLQPTDPPGPHRNPKVTIETDTDPLTIGEVYEEVLLPALLAWGFAKETLDEQFGEV